MNKTSCILWACCVLTMILNSCKSDKQPNLGDKLWKGVVAAGKDSVTVYFAFDKNFLGDFRTKISIPDQSLYDVEASACHVEGDSVFLEFSNLLKANIKAKIGDNEIIGKWEQGGHTFALELKISKQSIFEVYVERTLSLAQAYSVYSQSDDWQKLRQEVLEVSKNADNTNDLLPAFQLIFRTLKDKHGFVQLDGHMIRNETDDAPKVDKALKRAAYGHNKEIVSRQLPGLVAYIRVPGFNSLDDDKLEEFNQQLQSQICKLTGEGSKNWIIDLRLNEGGNMFPMLGGLNQLLGDGQIGSSVYSGENEKIPWIIKNGNYYHGEGQMTTSGKKCNARLKVGKVAVLTGPLTASSGEAVAIALRGEQTTKHFGEPTRGRTTGVTSYLVGKDLIFFFSASYYADRNGEVYKNGIRPDIIVEGGDNFAEIEQDSKVHAALKWMQE
jgi:carboxyl-terminal processing protease